MPGTVLITGGSRGIGKACTQAFARAGWTVVFLYRDNDAAAEQNLSELQQEELRAEAIRCDVTDAAAVNAVTADILRRYHRIDALINNAGVSHIGLFTDMTDMEIDRVLNCDLKGCMYLCRAVLPGMVSVRRGSIINIASMWGEVGASCEAAYSAAKAGMIGLTKALAKEAGPSGVRVNCVSPGLIATEMNAHLTQEDLDALVEEIPLGRMGTPEDVADACLFLAGEGASFITGQVLGVNGGMVI